ncbi:MAG: hypothetical protein HYZ15_04645 [Sphingobacteriales bacterium]|nr:hypothetical protein [Sphingobacteriales bacterium]
MNRLLKIDELVIAEHYHLNVGDECYYFMEYESRAGYSASEANNLISNFKKSMSFKGHASWKYKTRAIVTIANIFQESLADFIDFEETTLVPIPPSKNKSNADHDDRMLKTLNQFNIHLNGDVRELILMREDMQAAHESQNRPSPQELKENMIINEEASADLGDTVILFDDVLTTGAHFIACKNLIQERFPEKKVIGIFVARRKIPVLDIFDFVEEQ